MASAWAHAAAAAALSGTIVPRPLLRRAAVLGMACSVLPDADALGYRLGIPYGDLWGHRGMTHSLLFAVVTAFIVTVLAFPGAARGDRLRCGVFLFVVTASHGLFDALTNGGLGVAFFSPFETGRYFLPWRPVEVSPLGITAFFSSRGLHVLISELRWILVPWLGACAVLGGIRRATRRRVLVTAEPGGEVPDS